MPPLVYRDILPKDLDPKQDPSLAEVNQRFKELYQQANVQAGYYGNATINGPLNLTGNRIMNVGAAQEDTDVLTTATADPMYSTPVQQAAMEAVGNRMLQTTRRLNDGTQQHKISSDLNTQGSIPPSNVTGLFTWLSTSTTVTMTWTGIVIQLADGTFKAIKDGTLTITGLATAVYYVFPFYDTELGYLTFVADNVNASGVPPIAFLLTSPAVVSGAAGQVQTQDGSISLAEPSSGTGGNAVVTGGLGGQFKLRQQI
jgi:hypothetical protein